MVAHNAKGEANVAAEEIIGYSGEDVPAEAPENFMIRSSADQKEDKKDRKKEKK